MIPNTPTLESTSYSIDWFTTISDIRNLTETVLNDIARSFKKQWRFIDVLNNRTSFWGRTFYNYWEHIFMFEYSSEEELQRDSDEWSKYFNKKNDLTSETIDWKQVLESSWYFEYQWNYYLLWVLYQDMNMDDNNEERWIYKWVIVDMKKYNSTKIWGQWLAQKMSATVKGIIQPKE